MNSYKILAEISGLDCIKIVGYLDFLNILFRIRATCISSVFIVLLVKGSKSQHHFVI